MAEEKSGGNGPPSELKEALPSVNEAPPSAKAAPPPEKGPWDKADIVFKGLSAFMPPITVALIGFFGSQYLSQHQLAETNARAYVELVSRREEADTNLRREMFSQVLQQFLKPDDGELRPRILKLELLAYNFHDSFNLGPLFQDLRQRIASGLPNGELLMDRLKKVSQEISDRQVQALTQDGVPALDQDVDFTRFAKEPGGFNAIDRVIRVPAAWREPGPPLERRFTVDVIGRNLDRREVRIRLAVTRPHKAGGAPGEIEVDVTFWAGFFEFPGIDNTRLSRGERCAVVLKRMEDESAQITLSYFQAARASLKDKMYVEELMSAMLKSRNELAAKN